MQRTRKISGRTSLAPGKQSRFVSFSLLWPAHYCRAQLPRYGPIWGRIQQK
jgi:hypothetical protein